MKNNGRTLLAWLMMLLTVLNLFPVQSSIFAQTGGDDVTGVLTAVDVEVKQGGNNIAGGGELSSTDPIAIKVSFGVPVRGDYPEPAAPVNWGDRAVLELSSSFKLYGIITTSIW